MTSRGGKKQLRRSISLTAEGYERLRALADLDGSSMAAVVEGWVEFAADAAGISVDPAAAKARANERHQRLARERADRLARLQREAFG